MGIFSKKEEKPVEEAKVKKEATPKVAKVKPVKPVKKEKKVSSKKTTPNSHVAKSILVRPLITEKVTDLAAKSQYVFAVHPNVNKIEVKNEIKKAYNVEAVKVNMITVKGKKVRFGKSFGKQKDWKKAIVILKDGEKINVGKES